MTTTYKPTYRDLRTNAEEIADEIIKERVLAGIELLTEKYGPDWVDHIDPASLTLSSSTSCVLGQLYDKESRGDGFFYALSHDLSHINPVDYAFDEPDADDGEYDPVYTYSDLDEAWRIAFGADDA